MQSKKGRGCWTKRWLHTMTALMHSDCRYSSGIDYICLDSGFGATSLFMKFSKSGWNHLSDCIGFHCSPKVPYLKQFLIHCNHPVHSLSLSTFLWRIQYASQTRGSVTKNLKNSASNLFYLTNSVKSSGLIISCEFKMRNSILSYGSRVHKNWFRKRNTVYTYPSIGKLVPLFFYFPVNWTMVRRSRWSSIWCISRSFLG